MNPLNQLNNENQESDQPLKKKWSTPDFHLLSTEINTGNFSSLKEAVRLPNSPFPISSYSS